MALVWHPKLSEVSSAGGLGYVMGVWPPYSVGLGKPPPGAVPRDLEGLDPEGKELLCTCTRCRALAAPPALPPLTGGCFGFQMCNRLKGRAEIA